MRPRAAGGVQVTVSAGPMRYCPICGAINPPDVERCVSCRRVLPGSEQPPTVGTPTPAQAPGSVTWSDPFGGVPGSSAQPGDGQAGYGDYDYSVYGPPQTDDATYQQTAPYSAAYGSYDPYGSPASTGDTFQYGSGSQTQSYAYEPPNDPPPPSP